MNEIIFFIQIAVISIFAFAALKLGRSALTAWVAIQALIANLFVLKQVALLGFNVTASDAFAIGSLLGISLLQEYYGKEEAQRAAWICFFFMVFFTLVSQLHLMYESSVYDTSKSSFEQLLSPAPRLLSASLAVFLIVQKADIALFAFLKNNFPKLGFPARTTVSLAFSQFLDTFLFSFAGLYGIVISVIDIIIVSFAVKLTVIFCMAPFLKWTRK